MLLIRTYFVPESDTKQRLLDHVLGLFEELPTRNSVKKAIKKGALLLNWCHVEQGRWLHAGDKITLYDLEEKLPKAYDLEIPVVYEDDFFAVENKPAGIAVNGNQFRTVENALVDILKPSERPDALKWGKVVHRLDVPTSGLLVVAKCRSAHKELGLQFESRSVQKKYCAVVTGQIDAEGQMNEPVNGLEALSFYKRLAEVPSLRNGKLSLVELSPKTGRTHQLRIHLAGIGHPIVGDGLYGEQGNVMRHKGLFLAATELYIAHPGTGLQMHLAIDMPDKFPALLAREERRWKKYNP